MSEYVHDLMLHNNLASVFFPALLLSLWLTPAVIRISPRLNAVDHPGGRKIHRKAVSRLGGVAMAVGMFFTLAVFGKMDRTLAGFLAGAALVVLTGILDDLFHIPPVAKIVGEVAGACVFVLLGGVSLVDFGDLLGVGVIHAGQLSPAFTVICMVGVMNALNLSDGLDGLAGGIGVIACVFLGMLAYLNQHWIPLHVILALLGALFGFLRYNTYPAKLFMGDSGSLLIGYSLSAVTVLLVRHDGTGVRLAPVTVAAILALPIMDTLLVMVRRIRHGENPFLPDRRHLHHLLLDLGIPHAVAVTLLYISVGAFGLQAWLLRESPEWVQFVAVILLVSSIHCTVIVLQRAGFCWRGGDDETRDHAHPDSAYSFMARLMGKSNGVAAWAIGAGLVFPLLSIHSVPPLYSGIALAVLVFVGVLFPWNSGSSRVSVSHGLFYLACLSLLSLLQAVPGMPSWIPGYHGALSTVVFVWVLLKMKYHGHREIVQVSSFEVLLLGITFFALVVLLPPLGFDNGLRKLLLVVSMESVAFLLAMKIILRRQHRKYLVLALSIIVSLGYIAAKGFLSLGVLHKVTALSETWIPPIIRHN